MREIGPHRLHHGNVMDSLDELVPDGWADLMYADPPWGSGSEKMFATMNKKATGAEVEQPGHRRMLERIYELARAKVRPVGHLVVEYGKKWRPEVLEIARASGLRHQGTAICLYRSKFEMDVHLFGQPGAVHVGAEWRADLNGQANYQTVKRSVEFFAARLVRPLRVFDPFTGLGANSTRATIEAGGVFYGSEMNAARLARAALRLERANR